MVSRRGVSIELVTDNGGRFVAANKELIEAVVQLDKRRLQRDSPIQQIKWDLLQRLQNE